MPFAKSPYETGWSHKGRTSLGPPAPRWRVWRRPLAEQLVLLLEDEAQVPSTEDVLPNRRGGPLAHNSYQAVLVARRVALTAAVLDASACDEPESILRPARSAVRTVNVLAGPRENVDYRWSLGPIVRKPLVATELVRVSRHMVGEAIPSRACSGLGG